MERPDTAQGSASAQASRVKLRPAEEVGRGLKMPIIPGKFHSPDNSLLSFCSSPFKVEVQCQPQRGGTDRHEIHETAGC